MSRFLKTEASGGLQLSEELIRVASGHFDLEIVQQLGVSSLSINYVDRGVTSQLLSITALDISKNNLTSIDGLAPLSRTLIRLDFSYNNVSSGIDTVLAGDIPFGKLEVLRMQGNMIREMPMIINLSKNTTGLPKLRAIYLREQNFKGANPVCEIQEDYSELMAKYFIPKCRCIDGHYFCHEDMKPKRLDDGNDDEMTLPVSKPWVSDNFFTSAVTEKAGEKFGANSEKEVKKMVGEVKVLLESKINV